MEITVMYLPLTCEHCGGEAIITHVGVAPGDDPTFVLKGYCDKCGVVVTEGFTFTYLKSQVDDLLTSTGKTLHQEVL